MKRLRAILRKNTKEERQIMTKRSVLIIICVVLISLLLGAVNSSSASRVRADDAPPIPQGADGEWPAEFTPEPQIQTVIPSESEELEKLGTESQLNLQSQQYVSYGGLGLVKNFQYTNPRATCVRSGENYWRLAYQNIDLPSGSLIWGFDFSGYDYDSTDDVELRLYEAMYDGTSAGYLAQVGSGNEFAGGKFTKYKYFNPPVEVRSFTRNLTFELVFPPYVSGSEVSFCHVALYYTPPSPFAMALPLINK